MTRMVILHYHLFKNAGTSLDEVLKRNFADRWVTREFDGLPASDNHRAVACWLAGSPEAVAFSSHTAMGPVPRLPETRVHAIMFLRDPLDRIRSAYAFERVQTFDSPGTRIARRSDFAGYVRERLDAPRERFCRNFHCHRLAVFCRDPQLSEPERARQGMERLGLVGLVEHFEDTMMVLEAQIAPAFPGFRAQEAHANRGQAPAGATLAERHAQMREELGEALWEELVAENAEDMRLHALALERLRSQAAAHGLPGPGNGAAGANGADGAPASRPARPASRRLRPPLILGAVPGTGAGAEPALALLEGAALRVVTRGGGGPVLAAAADEIGVAATDIEAAVLTGAAVGQGTGQGALAAAPFCAPAPAGTEEAAGLSGLDPALPWLVADPAAALAAGALAQSGFETATVILAGAGAAGDITAAWRYDGRLIPLADLAGSAALGWRHLALAALAGAGESEPAPLMAARLAALAAGGRADPVLAAALAERWYGPGAGADGAARALFAGAALALPLDPAPEGEVLTVSRAAPPSAPALPDLAAAAEEALARRLEALCAAAAARTGLPRIVLAGLAGLVPRATARLAARFGADNLHIAADPGPALMAAGAAMLGAARLNGAPLSPPLDPAPGALAARRDPFLGLPPPPPAAGEADGLERLAATDGPQAARLVARLLAEGAAVGLVAGRAPSGPGAAGARAVLAGPQAPALRAAAPGQFLPLVRGQDFARFFTAAEAWAGATPGLPPVPAVLRGQWRGRLGALSGPEGRGPVRLLPGRASQPMLWDILAACGETGETGETGGPDGAGGLPVIALAGPEAAGTGPEAGFAPWAAALAAGRIDALCYDGALWQRAGADGAG